MQRYYAFEKPNPCPLGEIPDEVLDPSHLPLCEGEIISVDMVAAVSDESGMVSQLPFFCDAEPDATDDAPLRVLPLLSAAAPQTGFDLWLVVGSSCKDELNILWNSLSA